MSFVVWLNSYLISNVMVSISEIKCFTFGHFVVYSWTLQSAVIAMFRKTHASSSASRRGVRVPMGEAAEVHQWSAEWGADSAARPGSGEGVYLRWDYGRHRRRGKGPAKVSDHGRDS